MKAPVRLELPQGVASVTWRSANSGPFEWEYPTEAFPGVTLAEIDRATGLMPSQPGGTLHESTADFLKSLETRK